MPAVQVKILATSDECLVQGTSLKCDLLAAHLKDTLKVSRDTTVFVSADSAGLPMRRLSEVADQLRQAGYPLAIAAAFINEADGTTIEPP
jgi:biopolymer transport protein ExbD